MVYLNDKPITLPALRTALEQRAKAQPDTEVQLNADTTVPYGKIVEVMGMAQGVGLKRIGFVADPQAAAVEPQAATAQAAAEPEVSVAP